MKKTESSSTTKVGNPKEDNSDDWRGPDSRNDTIIYKSTGQELERGIGLLAPSASQNKN